VAKSTDHVGAILTLLELALLHVAVRLFAVPVLTDTELGLIVIVRVSDTSRLFFFVHETISIAIMQTAVIANNIALNLVFMFLPV
jgi:hypothetical protein